MTTINMQYWLGANERTHVLPTDKWYLDFTTPSLTLQVPRTKGDRKSVV